MESLNPATGETIAAYEELTPEEVGGRLDQATDAFRAWRRTPHAERARSLAAAAGVLRSRSDAYARLMTQEMGKVIKETRGDTQEAIDMTFYMAGEGRRLFGMTTPSEMENKFNMTVRQPLGVCSFITPWNFPMAIPSWKMMPAMICGNTVVIKPATDTPLSVVNLIQACHDEGIPPGVVNMVTGSGSVLGAPIIKNPNVRVVSFTGSTEVGRKVSEACATDFKHCCLEMGGKNVQIVMDDAKLDLAVDGALWGAFGTTGQRCTATSRIVCHKDVVEKFTSMIVERASKLKVGNGLDESVEMGPAISQAQLDTVLGYIEIGKKDGAKLLTGGERLTGGDYDKGFFLQPTVFGEVTQSMRIWKEEIFGPVLGIAVCGSLDEAIAMANDTPYGLSASIFTQDVNNAYTAMRDVYTGIFYVNAPTIGAETHLPFGGTKETGNGHREAATACLDVFSEWKSIYVDFSGSLQRPQIDNQ